MIRKCFFGIDLDLISTNETLQLCKEWLSANSVHTICFVNAHCYNVAMENNEYMLFLRKSDLVLNDGIGIRIGSMLNDTVINENMNGTDLIPKILDLACSEGKRIFLLGSKDGIAERAKGNLALKHPEIEVVGTHSGYFTVEESNQIIDMINTKATDVLVLGMGVPMQELWISKNLTYFKNLKIIIAGGAILDFLSGDKPRAPKWVRLMGLEWFFRFLLEPQRLFKRYFIGNFKFFFYIISFKLKRKPINN